MLYTSLSTGCYFHAKPTSLTICFSYVSRPRGLSQNCWGFWPGGDSVGIGSEHLVHQDEHLYSKLQGQLTLQIACNLPDSVWEASIKVEKSQTGDVCCTTEFSEPSKTRQFQKNAIFHTYIPIIQHNYGTFPIQRNILALHLPQQNIIRNNPFYPSFDAHCDHWAFRPYSPPCAAVSSTGDNLTTVSFGGRSKWSNKPHQTCGMGISWGGYETDEDWDSYGVEMFMFRICFEYGNGPEWR